MKNQSFSQKNKSFFIPEWVQDLDLSATEMFLLSLILSLDNEDHCYASNGYLAERTHLSPSRISFYINKFKKLGLIKSLNGIDKERKIHVISPKPKSRDEHISKNKWYAKTGRGGTCFHDSPHIYKKQEEEEQQTGEVVVVSSDEEKKQAILESKGLSFHQFRDVSISNLEESLAAADQYAMIKPVQSYQALCARAIRSKWTPNKITIKTPQKLHPMHEKCKKYLEDHRYLFTHDYFVKDGYFFELEEDRFYANLGRNYQPTYYNNPECFANLEFSVKQMKKQKEIL